MTGFFPVLHDVIDDQRFKPLSPTAKALYLYLCKYNNRYKGHREYFTKGDRALSKDSGMSRKLINKARQELINSHLIWCVRNPKKRTRYAIIDPETGNPV